ncbi:hatching enzyme 1.2 isoform X2 [Parasteatoda tepidariorum]|uniref:hatching enzyme 1.2 isoform X2 n=1 Tax=Parasteatoda tepidariorum TaxID=114398 RepID=UPI000A2C0B93|nr:zinc metalloproteinase nas-4 isoform X2 [Parasteatoda tepidariorum]
MRFLSVLVPLMVLDCVLAEFVKDDLQNVGNDLRLGKFLKLGLPDDSYKEDFFNRKDHNIAKTENESEEDLGLPLTPDDFTAGQILKDEDFAPKLNSDPIHTSGHFEGDIKDPKLIQGRNAIRDNRMKWPRGEIPYIISGVFGPKERSIIARAIDEYHRQTCIRFLPRTNEEDFVLITRKQGCFSMIGRDGGRQMLSLGEGCMFVGIVIHEFMHAVGFWHEQSRADRDNYVQILWENIQQGQTHNFAKYTDGRLHHLGEDYDYDSIMHYGSYDFTKYRNRPTILPKNRDIFIGQRSGFSRTDLRKINKLYQCSSQHKKECTDTDSQCRGWAENGECKRNPKWMVTNCRKSCNQCRLKRHLSEKNETVAL